ncbi:UbiA prenyltransferase family protein [Deltaproteobacteria bacterium TL4]
MSPYLQIARPDHWVKHVFIIPGIILGMVLDEHCVFSVLTVVVGFFSSCLIASANYVINEYCDAEFDRYHPTKHTRPVAAGTVKNFLVLIEFSGLVMSGLILAWTVSVQFWGTSFLFFIMGLVYNVKPFRFKDMIYLDVITESFNNPLRMILGWSMVASSTLPPNSLLISYWFGGAFLMSCKRLSEYRELSGLGKIEELKMYRKSFRAYTENTLIASTFLYALVSSFFASAFLIKYRNEYLLVFPVFASLFTYYLYISLKALSIVQTPEKLHKDKILIGIVMCAVALLIVLTIVDVPLAQKIIGVDQKLNYKFW